jgi:hypothetical protein
MLTLTLRKREKRNKMGKKRKEEFFTLPLKTYLSLSRIHYESTTREQSVIHTFAHLITVSLISFLHIVRSNSLRIHHSDKRRREETRRDEV